MFLLSIEFALFVLIFLPIYWSFARLPKIQNGLLLLAGLAWLYRESMMFAATVMVFASMVYSISRLTATQNTSTRRIWGILGIVLSIGVLAFFKYFDFFRPWLQQAFGQNQIVDILMPLGLSYYVFQSIAYLVYCQQNPTGKRLAWHELLLHLSFFPTITAGPIIRATEFKTIDGMQQGILPQIQTIQPRRLLRPALAISLITLGLAKKWWLAGSLAEGWVSPVFENPAQFDGWSILTAIYGYTFQLFFDFSGYSDLVIGIAMLLGFQLPKNFAAPLRAVNIRDFWNRWHISLSAWIRDYIYIPLGGSRKGFGRMQMNLLIAMVLSGIWHGYGWNFLIWGALHGLALVALNVGDKLMGKTRAISSTWLGKILAILLTFHFVCFTFVVFNTQTPSDALVIFQALFQNSQGWQLHDWSNVIVLSLFALFIAGYPWWIRLFDGWVRGLEKIPMYLWFILLIPLWILLIILAPSGIPGFIYANF